MINEDKNLEPQVLVNVTDEQKQKELLLQDEEEDFLDEGKFNAFVGFVLFAFNIMV